MEESERSLILNAVFESLCELRAEETKVRDELRRATAVAKGLESEHVSMRDSFHYGPSLTPLGGAFGSSGSLLELEGDMLREFPKQTALAHRKKQQLQDIIGKRSDVLLRLTSKLSLFPPSDITRLTNFLARKGLVSTTSSLEHKVLSLRDDASLADAVLRLLLKI